MDVSIGQAILAALTAGALDGAKDLTKKALGESYAALRDVIHKKYGHHEDVTEALAKLEKKPESAGYAQILNEELENCGAAADPALTRHASQLMELIKALPDMGSGGQIARGTGIAQADRQSAASVTIARSKE